MRIYYFGELIEDTNETKKVATIQTALPLEATVVAEEPQKSGMQSIGDILQELDLSLDTFRSGRFSGGGSHA